MLRIEIRRVLNMYDTLEVWRSFQLCLWMFVSQLQQQHSGITEFQNALAADVIIFVSSLIDIKKC